MSDWTTCRVVRDRTGRLRLVEDGTPVYSGEPIGALDYEYDGPFTPVLDADGLPVVRTAGDLTARHVGKRVRVEGHEGVLSELLARDGMVQLAIDDDEGPAWFPAVALDAPAVVLP